MTMSKPTLDEFIKFMEENFPGVELTEYQKGLAEALIAYRIKHFEGGLRSGRTFVIDKVNSFFITEDFKYEL